MAKENRIEGKKWVVVWFVGMVGQLLWNVENALFNTFAYRVAAHDAPRVIQWMVAASAIATTISTLLMGTWSDRVAKRRPFIAFGYMLWGAFTIDRRQLHHPHPAQVRPADRGHRRHWSMP